VPDKFDPNIVAALDRAAATRNIALQTRRLAQQSRQDTHAVLAELRERLQSTNRSPKPKDDWAPVYDATEG
jgi:hypothetical protein